MKKLLDGLKILDLSRLLPGPMCSLYFADMGAEVLKIEDPSSGGDYLRGMAPTLKNNSQGFCHVNRGKKSMTLDLRTPQGKSIFLRLVKKYDVVIESFRPGVMTKMGLGYKALKKINPKIIYCSITGFGQTGPLSQQAGHDINFVSYAGVLSAQGTTAPEIPKFQVGDLAGGSLTAAMTIMAAYVHAQKTKKGSYLDVSMLDGVFAMTGINLAVEVMKKQSNHGTGQSFLAGKSPCYQIYLTKDHRFMAFGPIEKKFWHNFLKITSRMDLEKYHMAEGTDADFALQELKLLFQSKTQNEWLELLSNQPDTCCTPFLTYEEFLQHPHVKSRKLLLMENHPIEGKVQHLAFPVKIDGSDFKVGKGAPQMGEHNVQTLKSLGFKTAKITKLKALKII